MAAGNRAKAWALRAIFELPRPLRRLLAGRPIRLDGQELDVDMQLLLRLQRVEGTKLLSSTSPAQARAALDEASRLAAGRVIAVDAAEVSIPAEHGTIRARHYTPPHVPATSGLLVFYHGGGWALGSLDSHDNACRLLALDAGVRVLSVDYRLAPEHPFPAAADDAHTAYRYAFEHAAELGADPAAIALGGDSAGANLAAVTAHQAALAGEEVPAFLLLFYPGVDATERRRSRELFSDEFFLTSEAMDWFLDGYQPDIAARTDPRLSVLLAEDLSGLPPTYLTTAGFDPLRDEGEAFAAKLAAAGVPVALRRHRGLLHGFLNFLICGPTARQAVAEAVGALRTGLAVGAARQEPATPETATSKTATSKKTAAREGTARARR